MADENPQSLLPVSERLIDFYGDQIPVALVDGEPFVPLLPISDFLGLNWSGQYGRLRRDDLLTARARNLRMTAADGRQREMLCLPLRLLPGWLFGVQPSRVRQELRDRLRLYQEMCYEVLYRETVQATEHAPVPAPSAALVQIRELGLAIAQMAEQQMVMEQRVASNEMRLDRAAAVVGEIKGRLGALERRLAPGEAITDEQAVEVSARVKALAELLTGREAGKNHYQGIFAELYRRFGVSSYKLIPQSKLPAVMDFLEEWRLAAGG